MSEEYETQEFAEADSATKTLDTKGPEDPNLYQDAEGGHAKIDTDKGTEGKDKKNKSSVSSKKSSANAKIDKPSMKEDMDALFDGEELSESFKEKASAIFEGAVSRRVSLIEEELTSLVEERVELTLNERVETLVESVNDYLSYVISEWVKENEIAIENGLRTDVAESFIRGLRDLLVENYIDLPEDRADAFDSLSTKMEDLEGQTNQTIAENISLRKHLLEVNCLNVFSDVTSEMVLTDVEKLRELSEGLEYENEDQYNAKLTLLRKSYFENTTTSDNSDGVSHDSEPEPEVIIESEVSPVMRKYLDTVSRMETKV